MTYHVKEIFYSLQGEGAQAGRPAIFCRFTGCNLWSGREQDRSRAICRFCDTDFRGTNGPGGGRYPDADALGDRLIQFWPRGAVVRPYIVCTGGEPLLQLDAPLVEALHSRECLIAVETNGTRLPPAGIDWVCVSPKAAPPLCLTTGDELKLVYPQPEIDPSRFESLNFSHYFLQPQDGPSMPANTVKAIDYCRRHPRWRLSMQLHKLVGIP